VLTRRHRCKYTGTGNNAITAARVCAGHWYELAKWTGGSNFTHRRRQQSDPDSQQICAKPHRTQGRVFVLAIGNCLLLYSTNTYLKYRIHRDFFNDIRYVWCSPEFDSSVLNRYARGAATPPSSDPKTIYTELSEAARRSDEHASKITSQKVILTALAEDAFTKGRLTETDRDELVAIVKRATFADWRPLLYVIPCTSEVAARATLVPRDKRASHEEEFIISDLQRSEFHLLEF
jgi:hypothetical protein